MTHIARYIDDPPQIFFWQIDEFIVFASCFGLGLMAGSPTTLIAIGVTLSYFLGRIKAGQADGFFQHILYWHAGLSLKGCPPSYIRSYIE